MWSKFCEFKENRFLCFLTLRIDATWGASYTLIVAKLIIADFNFASKAKREKKKINITIFSEFAVND